MTDRKILIIVEGRDNASGALHGVGGALSNIGQIAAGILAAGVFQRLADGIINLGSQGLDAIANYERLGMTLQTLAARELLNTGQTADMGTALDMASLKGKELLGWVEKLAIKSPFTSAGVADAFRTAMAYGFTVDQSKRLTQAMIDFAAGSGASEDSMGRIALALGQIQAKGKLSGQEVLQLVNAGLPVTQILAKAFHKTTAEIMEMQKDGLLPAKDVIEAITQSLEHDFAGAAERQSTSWAGLMGTFKDLKQIGLREFFGGIAQAAQPFMIQLSEWIQGDGIVKLREWGTGLGNIAAKFFNVAEAVLDAGLFSTEFFEALGANEWFTVFEDGSSHLGNFFEMLGMGEEKAQSLAAFLINGVGGGIEWVKGVIDLFRPGFEGLWAFWINNGPALSATVESTFGKLAVIGQDLAAKIIPWVAEKFHMISAWFNENGPLIQAFAANVGIALVWLGEKLAGLWTVVEPLLSGIIDLVLGLAKTIMQLVTGDWAGAWETFKSTMVNAIIAIDNAALAFVNWFLGLFGTSLTELKTWWATTWDGIRQKVSEIWTSIITTATGYVNKFIEIGKNIVQGIINGIKASASGVVSALKGVVDTAISNVKSKLGIKSPSTVFAGIGENMMRGLADGIGGGLSVPVNAVTTAMNSVTTGAMAGAGGGMGAGGGVVLQLTYAPAFSMADEYEFQNKLFPFIDKALRERGR